MSALREHERIYDAFVSGRLSKGEWTHEAHLVTCWMTLQTRSPAEAVDHLRSAITEHNCGIGIANTDESGYHETLTVYYVGAVAAAQAATPAALGDDRRCGRKGPSEFWSSDLLMSTAARRAWVPPDRAPLPWPSLYREPGRG